MTVPTEILIRMHANSQWKINNIFVEFHANKRWFTNDVKIYWNYPLNLTFFTSLKPFGQDLKLKDSYINNR